MISLMKKAGAATLAAILLLGCVSVPARAADRIYESKNLRFWNFDYTPGDWYYGNGWDGSYHGNKPVKLSHDSKRLRLDVDFSQDGDNGWAQIAVCRWDGDGMNLIGANRMQLDLIYRTGQLDGSFLIKVSSSAGVDVTSQEITEESGEKLSGNLSKATVTLWFDTLDGAEIHDWNILIIGNQTTYKGPIWLDNVAIQMVDEKLRTAEAEDAMDAPDDIYVDATVVPTDYAQVSFSDKALHSRKADGTEEVTELPELEKLADGRADANTRRMYAYLESMGKSEGVIFGHQSNTWQKAGSSRLSVSDTMDLTGSFAGIIGLDALALTGTEYSVELYNKQFGKNYEDTVTNRIKVYAELSNWNIENGAIMTLSSHMPNFAVTKRVEAEEGMPSYASYDFSEYTCVDLRGDTANKLLPGGEYNEAFNAYLDLIADYAKQVKDTVLFRPFHENTGSWFWWGAAFCDPETYKNNFRYAVEYLRDVKEVHNLLYIYGPGSEAATVEEYGERYPGDAWVDILGFDMYHSDPAKEDGWMEAFQKELGIVSDFAKAHGKLVCVSETGVARSVAAPGDSATALLRSGNQYRGWFQDVMDIVSASDACYFLTWTNFSGGTNGVYTPYVTSVRKDGTLHGHELMDEFIDFFNDPRTVFAINQKSLLQTQAPSVSVTSAAPGVTGYFTTPASGSRLLDETRITARVSGAGSSGIRFVLAGANGSVTLDAEHTEGAYYTATLSKEQLETLGESADGVLALYAGDQKLTEQAGILNIPEPVADPHLVDDFEVYLGEDALLSRAWAANKATGSSISISLAQAPEGAQDGLGMRFDYAEQSGGWAGVSISKETDWTDCDALQFWTIPDGNAQKTVIQVSANGKAYEAYMNLYDEYIANAGKPVLVTIPFTQFHNRDAAGQPKGGLEKDCGTITGFGLWVNAIDNAAFKDGMVSGSIWYDNIKAVKSGLSETIFEVP